ncbi:hypothetical protein A3D05_04190 [Candidatus Gottesmanbacteria bacterium RIFCSPHIGHO2_02_FULL_40_24]|uniref:DUF5666 domain-containing protein n=1 Tax=Candidatus Gottesmanbacteria bacterium RIFCSPHIGHO2_01_FULL_40_15 TaxID=1798376 RepID=A0A1F5Z1T0_9BACT|nr:MAG: hypothetical protein A2777_00980 [Candidatus Gottesmanbacteria bacterium RIFCSPHIGHO2_01_FULL_40_15]OGG17504.1 MAG: hypothetical protein A3D05_04190 [Candidatus Gottesmanbacteria bacterium RIFCSPHIGHO2_02_FULL_40_24]OGG21491.1 MAG: hypothetical protein A3B48_01715 [Candidatus Gottesmanbacteria bacterium RIFCSPLOWO2_01_FULL_40_10]OGG25147.1 MAG: hypothetical protein A3E42_01105 [Candidatus Gottesmanbacteria bacterium RIFCSPHIGHO2_12_FULL_40_13]OGG32734.1 MAG: hypothetical protein A3I80_0
MIKNPVKKFRTNKKITPENPEKKSPPKLSLLIAILLLIPATSFVANSVRKISAQTNTQAISPEKITSTPQIDQEKENVIDKLKQIEILKEKIATKVAQLRDQEKGAFYGIVKSSGGNEVVLSTVKGEQKFTHSEDTLVYIISDNAKKEAGLKDVKTGVVVSALGYFNENRDNLLAKYIFIQESFTRITGKLANIDKSNYTLTVKTKNGDILIDFEKYTVTSSFLKGKGKQKGGFSKFQVGDSVYIVGQPHEKEENRYHALRIIHLPMLISPTPESSPSAALTP